MTPSLRFVSSALFITTLAAVPCAALAQSSPPPDITDTTRQQAREHFVRGVELIQEARWLDAIGELEAARDLRVTPPVLYNLGLAQRAVGRNREAVTSFRGFLELSGPTRNAELGRQAESYIHDLEGAIGRLELRIEPAQSTVDIDGHTVAPQGGHLEVDPGRHVISTSAEGYAPESRVVEVPRGGTAVVVMRMVPVAIAAHLHVASNVASAQIRIDDHDVGFGTADENVRPGHHVIEVRAPRYATFHRDFDALPGTQTNLNAVLSDERTVFERPVFWIVAGAVVAAAAVTTVVLLSGTDPPYRGTWGLVTSAITVGDNR